jgi:hypothetical protein
VQSKAGAARTAVRAGVIDILHAAVVAHGVPVPAAVFPGLGVNGCAFGRGDGRGFDFGKSFLLLALACEVAAFDGVWANASDLLYT